MSNSLSDPLSPTARYAMDVANGVLVEDAAQAAALVHFQRLHDELVARENQQASAFDWLKLPFL